MRRIRCKFELGIKAYDPRYYDVREFVVPRDIAKWLQEFILQLALNFFFHEDV